MAQRILIAGGYGVVGSTIARHLAKVSPGVELVLAGRNPDKGTALARELGNARTIHLDVENGSSLRALEPVDLIVSALYDPGNALVEFALLTGSAHIGISAKSDDLAPITFAALASPPKRPIVLLGYSMAGAAAAVARKAMQSFTSMTAIKLTALFDPNDAVGAMTASDADMLISRALFRESGKWTWVDGREHGRRVRLAGGEEHEAFPAGVLDAPGLGAIAGAADVRLDMTQGNSLGSRAGGAASSDCYIDIAGVLKSGGPGKRRTVMTDPRGLAHLTALGVLVAAERVLGLDGKALPPGGLYTPETLIDPDAAIGRFKQFGVHISETDAPVV